MAALIAPAAVVHYNMPPLYEWNPRPAVLLWLKSKKRRYHTDWPKGKEQPYFRSVFAEASKLSKGIDDDHDQDSITFTAANEVNVKSKSKSSKIFWKIESSSVVSIEYWDFESIPVVSIEQRAVG